MTIWIAIFLFLHVMGAIVAFGPTFSAFPIVGQLAGKEPQHCNLRGAHQSSRSPGHGSSRWRSSRGSPDWS